MVWVQNVDNMGFQNIIIRHDCNSGIHFGTWLRRRFGRNHHVGKSWNLDSPRRPILSICDFPSYHFAISHVIILRFPYRAKHIQYAPAWQNPVGHHHPGCLFEGRSSRHPTKSYWFAPAPSLAWWFGNLWACWRGKVLQSLWLLSPLSTPRIPHETYLSLLPATSERWGARLLAPEIECSARGCQPQWRCLPRLGQDLFKVSSKCYIVPLVTVSQRLPQCAKNRLKLYTVIYS